MLHCLPDPRRPQARARRRPCVASEAMTCCHLSLSSSSQRSMSCVNNFSSPICAHTKGTRQLRGGLPWGDCTATLTPPPPLSKATVNDQKSTEPTRSVAWTSVLLTRYTVHGTCGRAWGTILKTQGVQYAAKAIMPKSASLTQNMTITHLRPKVSDSTHGTQQDQLKNAPPKSTVRKLTEPTPGVAWAQALLGHKQRWSLPSRRWGGGGGWHKALVVGSVSLWRRLLASRL